ncbi:hypothetical protein Tco_0444934 [Tanacetum coccineum]
MLHIGDNKDMLHIGDNKDKEVQGSPRTCCIWETTRTRKDKDHQGHVPKLNLASHLLSVLFDVDTAFGKHLEEKHNTWAQFRKKQDKKETLQDFNGALDLQCVKTALQFPLTPSKLEGDDVTIICDDVTVADLKKPIEDSAGPEYERDEGIINTIKFLNGRSSSMNDVGVTKSQEKKMKEFDEELCIFVLVSSSLGLAMLFTCILVDNYLSTSAYAKVVEVFILYQAYGNLYTMTGRKAYLFEDKKIPSEGVFDEVSFYTLFQDQFEGRQDKKPTLKDFDGALDLQYVDTVSQFPLTAIKA